MATAKTNDFSKHEPSRKLYQLEMPTWVLSLIFVVPIMFSFGLGLRQGQQNVDVDRKLGIHESTTLPLQVPPSASYYEALHMMHATRGESDQDSHLERKRRGKHDIFSEALVHPSLLIQPNPKAVAAFVFDNQVVKEVLKHKSVEILYLAEEVAVNSSVFSDDRLQVLHADDIPAKQESIDVIFWDPKYTLRGFELEETIWELLDMLSDDGILTVTLGEVPSLSALERGSDLVLDIPEILEDEEEFKSIKVYEAHRHLFVTAMTDEEHIGNWFANEAELNLAMYERMNDLPKYVDCATFQTFHFPPRHVEELFCTDDPVLCNDDDGHGFNPEWQNVPIEDFYVNLSGIPNAGRGLFTKKAIQAGSYMAIEECVNTIFVANGAGSVIDFFDKKKLGGGPTVTYYVEGYGFQNTYFGPDCSEVSARYV